MVIFLNWIVCKRFYAIWSVLVSIRSMHASVCSRRISPDSNRWTVDYSNVWIECSLKMFRSWWAWFHAKNRPTWNRRRRQEGQAWHRKPRISSTTRSKRHSVSAMSKASMLASANTNGSSVDWNTNTIRSLLNCHHKMARSAVHQPDKKWSNRN